MFSEPFYDPEKSYLDNFEHGPFGLFAETTSTSQTSEPKRQFPGHPVFAFFDIPAGTNGLAAKAKGDFEPGRTLIANHDYTQPLRSNVCGNGVEFEFCARDQGAGA
jgi:hypothetical protein